MLGDEADLKAHMHKRVDGRAARLHRQIDAHKLGGEEDRLWLDKYALNGTGLDIACGDFLIGIASGVDGDERKIGPDWMGPGDRLPHKPETQDFIVSNYFDTFPNPSATLNEWWRVLKKGGSLAIVVPDADKCDPLENVHKASAFTFMTIQHYLRRAGLTVKLCSESDRVIRVVGIK